jgi:hypothetical protein
MKKFKLLAITGAALIILAVLANCSSLTVVGIDNKSVTGPAQVRQYGVIDPSDITVYAFYKDGSRKPIPISRNDITFDSSRAGRQTVTVRVSGGFTASFETEVMALIGITVAAQPAAIKAGVGINPNWPGLQIQGAWDQMGSEKINNAECQITGLNMYRGGSQTITVAYKGKQTAFNVNVVDMESLRITSGPAKTTYYQGEPLVLAGLRAVGVWSGLSEETIAITLGDVTGYNAQTIGRQTLTVTKNGKTATFIVEVLNLIGIINGTWKGQESSLNGNEEYAFNNGAFFWKYRTVNSETRQINGTYTIESVNGAVTFTSGNADDQDLMRRWRAFSIAIDPRIAGELVRGTVLTVETTWSGRDGSIYKLSYIKQ